MPRVSVTHRTTYRYSEPVTFGPHRMMTRPRDAHDLRLVEATIALTPPATLRWKRDVFGNVVGLATFEAQSDTLEITSRLVVEHAPANPQELAAMLEPYAAEHPFAYSTEEIPDLGRTLERHSSDPERKVDLWAKQFLNDSGPTSTGSLLAKLTHGIKAQFAYAAREAEGTQSAVQTLETGSGTCRDFAFLMMEACRSLGLAARFVSGYLYDDAMVDAVDKVIGGGATHAWCEVYLPGAGWVEFDPTNGLVAGRNLIRIAVARDPAQAIPLSGSWSGPAEAFVSMEVDVAVDAAPLQATMVDPAESQSG